LSISFIFRFLYIAKKLPTILVRGFRLLLHNKKLVLTSAKITDTLVLPGAPIKITWEVSSHLFVTLSHKPNLFFDNKETIIINNLPNKVITVSAYGLFSKKTIEINIADNLSSFYHFPKRNIPIKNIPLPSFSISTNIFEKQLALPTINLTKLDIQLKPPKFSNTNKEPKNSQLTNQNTTHD